MSKVPAKKGNAIKSSKDVKNAMKGIKKSAQVHNREKEAGRNQQPSGNLHKPKMCI